MQLKDQYNRLHNYLRISLTDECNFRCMYCMPNDEYDFLPLPQLMQADEIIKLANIFVQLGVNKIRLTGGEPLIRKEAGEIITGLSRLPVELTLTTNGVLLPKYLPEIKQAGMRSVNISLDSLQEEKFNLITKRNSFKKVWNAINVAVEAGLHVKVNVVVIKGVNDNEILDFIEWTKYTPVHVRFIEFMPFTGNRWDNVKMVPWQHIYEMVNEKYEVKKLHDEVNDTARKFIIPTHAGTFAFISTMSSPFCSNCNRLRLTADGKLKNCLFSKTETDILTPFRKGENIVPLILHNVHIKEAELGGQFSTKINKLQAEQIQNRSMIAIGG